MFQRVELAGQCSGALVDKSHCGYRVGARSSIGRGRVFLFGCGCRCWTCFMSGQAARRKRWYVHSCSDLEASASGSGVFLFLGVPKSLRETLSGDDSLTLLEGSTVGFSTAQDLICLNHEEPLKSGGSPICHSSGITMGMQWLAS